MKKLNSLSFLLTLLFAVASVNAQQPAATPCGAEDHDCKIREAQAKIKANAKDPEPHYTLGRALQAKGDNAGAIAAYDAYLKFPGVDKVAQAEAYNSRGIAYKATGKIDQAIADYAKAIELSPTDPAPLANRGDAYSDQKKTDLAIVDYDKAIAVKADYAPAYLGRAMAYNEKKDAAKALTDVTKAIELNANDWRAFYLSGVINSGKQDFQKAITDFDKFIALNAAPAGEMSNGYLNRGIAWYAVGDLDKAVADFSKSIENNPSQLNAYKARAYIYKEQKKDDLAAADEKKVAELSKPK